MTPYQILSMLGLIADEMEFEAGLNKDEILDPAKKRTKLSNAGRHLGRKLSAEEAAGIFGDG